MKGREKEVSKLLSYILRHAPESAGITLQPGGWVEVDTLLSHIAIAPPVSRAELDEVVANNSKQRFEFSDDGSIRARQGHSVPVDLDYVATTPPDVLYHGTAEHFLDSILQQGLIKKDRHHVHMSTNRGTMLEVARRHGKAVLLKIDAAGMHAAGYEFFVTGNHVWLTDHIPIAFLSVE